MQRLAFLALNHHVSKEPPDRRILLSGASEIFSAAAPAKPGLDACPFRRDDFRVWIPAGLGGECVAGLT